MKVEGAIYIKKRQLKKDNKKNKVMAYHRVSNPDSMTLEEQMKLFRSAFRTSLLDGSFKLCWPRNDSCKQIKEE